MAEFREVAQLGSASVSGTEGYEFKSRLPDQLRNIGLIQTCQSFFFCCCLNNTNPQKPIRDVFCHDFDIMNLEFI